MCQCWALLLVILDILSMHFVRPELVNEFVIELAVKDHPKEVLESMGFELVRKLDGFERSYLAKLPENSLKNAPKIINRIKRSAEIVLIEQQEKLIRTKRDFVTWNDPKYPDMWYLNRASLKDGNEVDLNVQEAWQLGYSGKGVVVTIMDDGLDYTHPDLAANYAEEASCDVNNGDRDPMPNTTNPDNKHGTRCAGQVAAIGNNSNCIVGIAFNAKIGGIRMLDGTITDRVEAESLNFNQNYIDIYSGSWGPDDTGRIYEGPGRLASEAFHKGATTGRNGLGNIFVWASGNGGRRGDSCAADGYVSSIYTLAVSSVTEDNKKPWYLEKCAAVLVSTYSSESGIVTTDLNHGCTNLHTGTSASAPLAVGIIALMLEANPKLTWRDVQYVTMLTANPRPFKDGNFSKNGAGYLYSNYYGFGLMDAGKSVRLSELWRTLPPHHRCATTVKQIFRNLSVQFSETYAFNFTGCRPTNGSNSQSTINEEGEPVNYVEHIQIFLTVRYNHRGLVRVQVISPSGTKSELMPVRLSDMLSKFDGIDRWPLMSVQFWGEPAAGEWKIIIDNMEGIDRFFQWRTIKEDFFEKSLGHWDSVYMIAYGTETFPIRLRSPNKGKPPPSPWFDRFAQYVVSDLSISPSGNTCHSQCATNDCWGPLANQCVKSCKNYVTESGQCVAVCPSGTTALISSIRAKIRSQTSKNYAREELRCELCSPTCAECLRPRSEYDCTACSGDTYLAPLLSPNKPMPSTNPSIARLISSATAVRGSKLLVGSCVPRCPSRYFANRTSKICEQCAPNCEECSGPDDASCLKCAKNFRFVDGKCTFAAGTNRCPKGSFLKGDVCIPCDEGCDIDSCSEYGLCTYCDEDHRYMLDGRCEKSCPSGFYPAFRLTKEGLYHTSGNDGDVWACAPCPPGCANCTASSDQLQGFTVPRCSACHKDLILDSESALCNSSCPIGAFSPNCSRTCHPSCLTCVEDSDSCLQCPSATYLAFGEREINHMMSYANTNIDGYGCVNVCPDATYPFRIGEHEICLSCPPLCKSCSGPNWCTSCNEGYTLNETSGKCEIEHPCPQMAYFDENDKQCRPCHPSCARCQGPNPTDCLECHRIVGSNLNPSPACLPIPQFPRFMQSNGAYESNTFSGPCIPCCHVGRLLEIESPKDCFFCLPNEPTCTSWSLIGGGFDLYGNHTFQMDFSNAPKKTIPSLWNWLKSDPVRLSFFITAIITTVIAMVYLIYHLTKRFLRKQHIRDYHSLFLRNGETGSRLSQRCPESGSSPVMCIQPPPPSSNGTTNGWVPSQRVENQSANPSC